MHRKNFHSGCIGLVSVMSRSCLGRLGDVSVMSRWCLGHVSVLPRSCLGLFLLLSPWCPGDVSVMSRWCLGHVSVLSRSSLGHVSVMSRSCLGRVSVVSRSCLGVVLVMSRSCFGHVSVLSWSCFGRVSVLSRWCLGHVSVVSRPCLCLVSVMSRSCLGGVSVMSRSCLGRVSVMSRCCFGHVSVMSRSCLGLYAGLISMGWRVSLLETLWRTLFRTPDFGYFHIYMNGNSTGGYHCGEIVSEATQTPMLIDVEPQGEEDRSNSSEWCHQESHVSTQESCQSQGPKAKQPKCQRHSQVASSVSINVPWNAMCATWSFSINTAPQKSKSTNLPIIAYLGGHGIIKMRLCENIHILCHHIRVHDSFFEVLLQAASVAQSGTGSDAKATIRSLHGAALIFVEQNQTFFASQHATQEGHRTSTQINSFGGIPNSRSVYVAGSCMSCAWVRSASSLDISASVCS